MPVKESIRTNKMKAPSEREAAVANGIPPAATLVSMTLKDIGGTVWAGAGGMAEFVPAPNIPGPYFWGGSTDFVKRAPFGADANGFVQIDIVDNTTVTPAGSTWRFTISPNATMPAVVFNLMIAGTAMDISSIFTAQSYQLQNSLVQSLFVPRAYRDSEVAIPPNDGQLYWNSSENGVRYWTGGAWHDLFGGNIIEVGSGNPASVFRTGIFGSATGFTDAPSAIQGEAQWLISWGGLLQFIQVATNVGAVLYYRTIALQAGQFSQWVQITTTPAP